jgi:hypothetical protein
MATKAGFYKSMMSSIGVTPCLDGNTASPQQKAVSCMAIRHGIAIAANVFTELANHSRRITEVVFDEHGTVVAIHDKVHLAPLVETGIFEPGPSKATTFELLGRRWGVLICYEAVYAFLSRDFSLMEDMVHQGATAFVWSIGGMVPPATVGKWLADRFHVTVVASETKSIFSPAGAVVASSGHALTHRDTTLELGAIGYTASAVVNAVELPTMMSVEPVVLF